MKFFRLTNNTISCLNQKSTSFDELVQYTKHFPLSKRKTTLILANDIQAAKDVISVFDILRRKHYITFFKFSILESIIKDLCHENTQLIKELEEYKSHFKVYIKRRVCETTLFRSGNFKLGDSSGATENSDLILITDDRWDKSTSLEAIVDLQSEVASILGIEEIYLVLKGVEENCLVLFYAIPRTLESTVLSLNHEQAQRLLHLGVAEIICRGYHILKKCK